MPHIFFAAGNCSAKYEVSLHNPLKRPEPAWRYKTELWVDGGEKLIGRSPRKQGNNPTRGLAAAKAADVFEGAGLQLLEALQDYVIYSPATAVLRGGESDRQPKRPIGLSGGNLPIAIAQAIRRAKDDPRCRRIFEDIRGLIDWATAFGYSRPIRTVDSPAGATSAYRVHFRDRYMREGRNVLSAQDASEGALYVLFLAVLAAHPDTPRLCAVDNADHGLNPRLAKALMARVCKWYIDASDEDRVPRQILLTTHNPLVLDGLPLQDDRVRLFAVARTTRGRTTLRRIRIDSELLAAANDEWALSRLWVMGHLGGMPDV